VGAAGDQAHLGRVRFARDTEPDALAISNAVRALTLDSVKELLLGGLLDHAQHRIPLDRQGNLHREFARFGNKLCRAVQRVHNPDPFLLQPRQIIVRLLGQQAIVGEGGPQAGGDQVIRYPVSGGHRLIAGLEIDG
jgi:hypothetical protein